jgi:hypothetical protein
MDPDIFLGCMQDGLDIPDQWCIQAVQLKGQNMLLRHAKIFSKIIFTAQFSFLI